MTSGSGSSSLRYGCVGSDDSSVCMCFRRAAICCASGEFAPESWGDSSVCLARFPGVWGFRKARFEAVRATTHSLMSVWLSGQCFRKVLQAARSLGDLLTCHSRFERGCCGVWWYIVVSWCCSFGQFS